MYPKGTNHLSPFSPLFKDSQSLFIHFNAEEGRC